jgi:hypothetical protein
LRLVQTGQIEEVGFAGTNGYSYTSPGRQMVADGVIPPDQLSLHGLGDYFAAHPEMMDHYLSLNQRDVFFAVRPGGPFGSLNVPITPLTSIATDKNERDIYPRQRTVRYLYGGRAGGAGDGRPGVAGGFTLLFGGQGGAGAVMGEFGHFGCNFAARIIY